MADLFNEQAPPPGTAATPTGKMPGQQEFGEETPSPDEQAQYDQLVNKALDFMSQNPDQVVASLNNKDKPVYESVGEMAYKIITNIESQANAAGVEISGDVGFAAGEEVIEHLMELGDAAGIFPFDQSSDEYDEVQATAYAHGANLAANEIMSGPQYGPEMQEEAGNVVAQQVAGERQRGEVDDAFFDNVGNAKVAQDKRAMQGR